MESVIPRDRREGFPDSKDFYLAIYFALAYIVVHFVLEAALFHTFTLCSFDEIGPSIARKMRRFAIWLLYHGNVPSKLKTKETKITKCKESMWKLSYYTAVQCFIFFIAYDEPWFGERQLLFKGWPDQTLKFPLKLFYMCQCGFYIYSIAALLMWETRRKDFSIMMSHHVITLFLIGYSYAVGFFRCGAIVLALHDTSDVFMEAAKLFKYCGNEVAASICFGLFALSWLGLRLMYFPLVILRSSSYDLIQSLAVPDFYHIWLYYAFNTMLFTLLVFHIYWGILICNMVSRQLKNKGKVGEDIRSDSEGEDN